MSTDEVNGIYGLAPVGMTPESSTIPQHYHITMVVTICADGCVSDTLCVTNRVNVNLGLVEDQKLYVASNSKGSCDGTLFRQYAIPCVSYSDLPYCDILYMCRKLS